MFYWSIEYVDRDGYRVVELTDPLDHITAEQVNNYIRALYERGCSTFVVEVRPVD